MWLSLLWIPVLGFVAGLVGTLMGIGGGSLVSPVLIALGFEPHLAVSSSLATVVGTGLGGLYRFLRFKLVRVRLGLALEVATVLGALGGSALALRVSGSLVELIVFAALLLAAALLATEPKPRGGLALAIPASMGAGAVSAMTGIGGGVIKMPILLGFLGLDIRSALATSKMMVGITAATGLANYAIHGAVDPALAIPLAISSFLGATLGARIVTEAPREKLRKLAVALYLTLAATTLLKALSTAI